MAADYLKFVVEDALLAREVVVLGNVMLLEPAGLVFKVAVCRRVTGGRGRAEEEEWKRLMKTIESL